ncbi:hypothetical protein [Campylobacter sp. US33a]|uniref:hypothetical protein n=1 Tax=Campylobacter sp. US33a TaxID=2498120 RepID=UPI001068253E|nr:hypothetical protein [Campylobacter sp. US33a]TEY02762.1 hypothetical protein ELQ16_05150 [Campylobacter sp. US33a]
MKITNDCLTNAYLQKSEISNHRQENKNFSEILEDAQEENKKAPPHAVSAKEVELLGGAMFVNAVRETMSI